MFSWICPKCGAEVPPAYTDCPRCAADNPAPAAAKTTTPVIAETPARAPAPPPAPAPAPQPVAQPQPPVERPVERVAPAPPPRIAATAPAPIGRQFPAWLASLLTAAGMALVLAVIYFAVRPSRPAERAQTPAPAPLEQAPVAKAENSQYAKHLELAGFRISEDKNQRVSVRFLVVNHSGAELPPLKGEVTLKAGRPGSVIDFPFVLSSLGPYEVKEVTSNTKTEVRAYELPDWQFIKPEFTVTETEAPASTPPPAPSRRRRR